MINNGKIVDKNVEEEVSKSFLDYSMSVIVSRALPDVRDGLKPVHRRILYDAFEQGITHEKSHRKSASIVGDVMAKFHPHGDTAIYETMVKMAQDFSMRYPLIDGHGNFGSIDGDAAAAMRYTESRMSKIASELLKDIDKETVDWRPNYDDSRQEPQVLPTRVPNLLVNGCTGIAVGMATSVPPHNLTEVIEALKAMMINPDINDDEINGYIKGPDFPTAGMIVGSKNITDAYKTGRGSVKVRAKADIEELKGGKHAIIVTEVPYMANKARMVERIGDLVRNKNIEGITDLRDESNRDGIRVVIELRKDVNPHIILNQLYKHTEMESTFKVIMLALVNGEPKILTLKEMLEHFLQHRREVITRRTKYELKIATKRMHIVEGLLKAQENIDKVVDTIRKAENSQEAKRQLISSFLLSIEQAEAILEMKMRSLTGLEKTKLETEQNHLSTQITDYKNILSSPVRIDEIIKEELSEINKKYGNSRLTKIVPNEDSIDEEDLIEDEEIVLTLTEKGYIKRQPMSNYKAQRRGGKGITGTTTKIEDLAKEIIVGTNKSTVLFFTNSGKVYSMKAYKIPEASRQAKGTPAINFLQLCPNEVVTNIISLNKSDLGKDLLFVTKYGWVKKCKLEEFANIRKSGIIALRLKENDELIGVKVTDDEGSVFLITADGKAIVFNVGEVRTTGRATIGVKGIRLNKNDQIIDIDIISLLPEDDETDVLIVAENGLGKRVSINEFREQHRGGKGVKAIEFENKIGKVIAGKIISKSDEFIMMTEKGIMLRGKAEEISKQKRYSRGVIVMKSTKNDKVRSLAIVSSNDF